MPRGPRDCRGLLSRRAHTSGGRAYRLATLRHLFVPCRLHDGRPREQFSADLIVHAADWASLKARQATGARLQPGRPCGSCNIPAPAGIIRCLTYAPIPHVSRFWMLIALVLTWLAWLLTLPPRPPAWVVTGSGLPLLIFGSWLAQRSTVESWRVFARRTLDWHLLALTLLMAFGIQLEDAHGITTDGVIYFSQLRSVIFDRDLDVAAEFAFLGQPPRPYHIVPIGPTLVWLPLYLAVTVVDTAGRTLGLWAAPEDSIAMGLTLPYVRAALVSSFVIGSAGLVVLHAHLRNEFGRAVAFAATLLLLGGTSLVWYMVYEPSMTHAASFGFVAMFVVAAARWTTIHITPKQSAVLGALLGLAFTTRPQEALFALFPAVWLLTTRADRGRRIRAAVRLAVWALAGALPFIALQAIHSTILLDREPFTLVGDGGYLQLRSSRWADTLWSSWHGFLSWTPVAYIALIGTVAYVRRQWRWALAALAIVFLMAWLNGSTADWPAGWSFGGRRFVSCLVVLAPGLALVVQALWRRPMIAVAMMAAGAIVWNQMLVAQYTSGMLPQGSPVSFAQIVRQQGSVLTRPPFFYPFAFPANVVFAWRTGLPVDRYDVLGPETLRASIDLTFDAAAGKFLMDGWGPRAADDWGDLRWMDGARAELVLPLDVSADRPHEIEVYARTRLLDPPLRVSVSLSINGQHVGTFAPDAQQPSTASFTVPANAGVWSRGFNRVVLENLEKSRGSDAPPVAIYRLTVR